MPPTMHGSNLVKAGDYKISKLVMRSLVVPKTIDIVNLYTKIEIFEDMFSPYMSGTISMNESFNLPEIFPITGQEAIEIEFKTDVENIEPLKKVFRIYKLSKHSPDPNGKGQAYTLHLISEAGLINYSQRCGYFVSGTVSNMVAQVVKKHFPDRLWKDRFDVENTKDNYSFVLPKNYTPFKAISWLSDKALNSSASDYSPFFFFETFDGYVFKSASKIIKDGSTVIQDYYYIKDKMSAPDGSPSSLPVEGPLSAVFHRVQALEEINRFNMAENIMSGMVSSRLITHDLLKKEKREQIFREDDVFKDTTRLGDKPHYKPSEEENRFFYDAPSAYFYLPSTTFTAYTQSNGITDNMKYEDYFLKRKYAMNTFMTQKIAIDIYGDSTKRVGQVINLYTPKLSADHAVQPDKADKNFSGQYLITSIRHSFSTAYSCKLELSRNAMRV